MQTHNKIQTKLTGEVNAHNKKSQQKVLICGELRGHVLGVGHHFFAPAETPDAKISPHSTEKGSRSSAAKKAASRSGDLLGWWGEGERVRVRVRVKVRARMRATCWDGGVRVRG